MPQVKVPKGATHEIISIDTGDWKYFLDNKGGRVLNRDGSTASTGDRWVGKEGLEYLETTFAGWTTRTIKPIVLENK